MKWDTTLSNLFYLRFSLKMDFSQFTKIPALKYDPLEYAILLLDPSLCDSHDLL